MNTKEARRAQMRREGTADEDGPQIDAEVAAIEAERDAAKPDPLPDPTSPTIVPGTDPNAPGRTVPPPDVPAEQ